MTRTLNKLATLASTVTAMIITFGLLAASADARPVFVKLGDIKGESQDNTSTSHPGQIKRSARPVCCALPRTGKLALTRPADCKKAKGRILPKMKCAAARKTPEAGIADIVTGAGPGGGPKAR